MDVLTAYERMLEDLISGKITSAEAVDTIKNTKELMGTINSYLRAEAYGTAPLADEDIQIIHAIIEVLQFIYNDSGVEPPISDTEYDRLYEMMVNGGGTEVIGYTMGDVGEAHPHKYPTLRGTLKKTYYLSRDEKRTNPSRKYLDEWIESAEKTIFDSTGTHVNLNDEDIYVFPKWDGVSGIQECNPDGTMVLGLTRGDTEHNIGYDITKHLAVSVPNSGITTEKPHGVKYEIMMENDGLDEYNEQYKTDYKSTRSIVSSIINSADCDERDELLRPIPLRYIEEGSNREILHPAVFKYPYIKCKLKDRDLIKKFANDNRYVDGKYRTDGAVIYIINPKLQEILGRSNEKNNFEVAYKFTEETALTEIKKIEFSVRNFGRITPVAVFKPVKIKGNTVSRASIGSKARFDTLQLAKGDEVVLHYDIIPYITVNPATCQRANRYPIEFVSECPACGEHLDYGPNDAIVKCPNPDCPSKATGRILNFIQKMKIKNISYATVDLLHKFGYLDSIKDLYKIESRMSDIMQIPTMGAVKVNRIIQSIQDRTTVKDYELFGALGIEGIAKETFKTIFDCVKPNDLMEAVEDKDIDFITDIKGIGKSKATKVFEGLRANRKTIRSLSKHIDVYHDDAPEFTVAFSKIRDNDGHLIELIESLGGAEVDSVTKDTSMLIVPSLDTEASSKIKKAREKGIPVVPFDEAESYIRNRWGE